MAKSQQQAPQTQSTTVTLAPEQRELLGLAMPRLREFAAQVPQRYSGPTVAGFDPSQVAGQEMALRAAPTQGALAQQGASTVSRLTGDLTDVNSNPGLRGAIDAATRPITENLLETALPAIRGEAVSTGNFGSSRQGIAEGQAIGRAAKAVGDASANLVNSTYDTNLRAQLQALGLLPSIQASQVTPAVTTSGVGDVRQSMEQARLNEAAGGFNYDQWAPFFQGRELASLVGGIPGGTTTSTASAPPPAPRGMQALGGAATGAALGSALFPGVGTAVGAGAGALLPFLF